MNVLVGCEFSGVVRRAFRDAGHEAWSCDLLPAEDCSEHHIQGDVREVIGNGWDLAIFHPPCTHLAVSGARHFRKKRAEQAEALDFVRTLMAAPVPAICVENPISVISTRIRKPDQIIQPWQFGHGETKATCLWLKGLPPLRPTNVVSGREPRVHRCHPARTDGVSAAGPLRALPAPWRASGEVSNERTHGRRELSLRHRHQGRAHTHPL